MLTAEAKTELERQLSLKIMRDGKKPKIRKLGTGETLTEQGQPGSEMYLLLDGVLSVEVDGDAVAEVGPGSILGERALIEEGLRTSTLRATTPVTVAVASAPDIQPDVLEQLASSHKREESSS